MPHSFQVICIGSALLDIYMKSDKFVKIPTGSFKGGIALCEEFGGKTEIHDMAVCSGGAGSNNAVSFARKGFSTALVAEMGQDVAADAIKAELVREHVDLSLLIQEASETTGVSSILVGPEGGRSVQVYRGASKLLTKSDINWPAMQADWFMISSLGGEMPLLEGLLGHAKAYGIKVAVNPGKAELEQLDNWGSYNLFDGAEILILNRQELGLLFHLDTSDHTVWQGDWPNLNCRWLIVTDGKSGGQVRGSQGERIEYQANTVTTIEETGAGDAFGSGVVAAFMSNCDIDTAINWGKTQAASVVQHMGAKQGLLSLETISKS